MCVYYLHYNRYMYALLTALPWVGRELFEKKENDLERIMAAMEGYLRRRNTAHVAALRVWNCDTPHPQVNLLYSYIYGNKKSYN